MPARTLGSQRNPFFVSRLDNSPAGTPSPMMMYRSCVCLNQALRYADRFIFLKDQHVHYCGTCDSVTPDVIEAVYGIPVVMGMVGGVTCVIPGEPDPDLKTKR